MSAIELFFEDIFSEPPSAKQRATYQSRLDRLDRGMAASTTAAVRTFQARQSTVNHLGPHLRIRPEFVFQNDPPEGWEVTSDRKAPPPELRPSATRLVSSGPALRFYLAGLADAQIRFRQGTRPDNPMPLRTEEPGQASWIDLMASPAVTTGPLTKLRITGRVKKERSLQRALQRLEQAGLVEIPRLDGKPRYDNFVLLREIGTRAEDGLRDYTVPRPKEHVLTLPAAFVTNGWLHVLEDSEIAVLLMVSCGWGRLPNEDRIAIPGDVRLLHYGLSRDVYEAHRLLAWLGLLHVVPEERWLNGTRAKGYKARNPEGGGRGEDHQDARLHRMSVVEEGFAANPADKLREVLTHQLSR